MKSDISLSETIGFSKWFFSRILLIFKIIYKIFKMENVFLLTICFKSLEYISRLNKN